MAAFRWSQTSDYPVEQVAASIESLCADLEADGYKLAGNPKGTQILASAVRDESFAGYGVLNWGKLCIDLREEFRVVIMAHWMLVMHPDLPWHLLRKPDTTPSKN